MNGLACVAIPNMRRMEGAISRPKRSGWEQVNTFFGAAVKEAVTRRPLMAGASAPSASPVP